MARKTKRLGRYHLTHRIAFGGMAEVFRGFTFSSKGDRHDVAVKKLLPSCVEDKQFITMLTDEYRLVSMLRHPNIAEVYEFVAVDDSCLIAMEFVDGKDLRSTMEKARKTGTEFRYDDIAYIMREALLGLDHAHGAVDAQGDLLRVVHRDFSPSNVLIGYDGTVKICDFGIAKARHNQIETKAGIIKGKVMYMSPEQAFGRPLDRRSDVFSAGSVLYELCTGLAPFIGKNEAELLIAVRKANPPHVRDLAEDIPNPLEAIIQKSMGRGRSQRYQTSKSFSRALQRFLKSFNPEYHRGWLGRFMKELWADEIEEELRALEEYVVDLRPGGNLGTNLIADALGPDPTYARFTPNPTGNTQQAPFIDAATTRIDISSDLDADPTRVSIRKA